MPQFILSQRLCAFTYDPSLRSSPAPARVADNLKSCWKMRVPNLYRVFFLVDAFVLVLAADPCM